MHHENSISLLTLPKEIRDEIWKLAAQQTYRFGYSWSSCGVFGPRGNNGHHDSARGSACSRSLLRTCRQILEEVTPLFYDRVCLNLAHTNQALRWLQTIGPRNSSCIRHLVIKYRSLLLEYNQERYLIDRRPAWAAALHCMPNLVSLTYDFEQEPQAGRLEGYDQEVLTNDTFLLRELANSANAWSKILLPTGGSKRSTTFHYRPTRSPKDHPNRSFNHAVIAIDEELPQPLIRYLSKLLQSLSADSLELSMTSLPGEFFKENNFNLGCTYAFNDTLDRPSITLVYHRTPKPIITANSADLKFILRDLPIRYFRIGCHNIGSSELSHIPPLCQDVETLDVAFTEPNPERVTEYLEAVHERCKKLFTFAIDVSPLHDRDPNDHAGERFFDRKSVSKEDAERWQPFWKKLDQLSASGVRVWEGESPGFRRTRVNNLASQTRLLTA